MAGQLKCVVVTPERTVLDEQAEFVALPLYDGEIGILGGRSPLIGRLGYGEMRIKRDDQLERYYVEGGFVEVVGDVVSVLTNRAIRAEDLDETRAREQLAVARERSARTPETMAIRERAVAQARAEIRVAQRGR
jgi:F-type H+-transporting ATPase subunit epsilon